MTKLPEFGEATVLRGSLVEGFSDEDFFRFCQENPELRVERSADNEIIIMPPAGFESSFSSGQAYTDLSIWQRRLRLGRVLESSVGYTLPDGAVLSPDASWVSAERLAAVPATELKKFPHLCPDFVIEVKSPSDRIKTLQAKMQQWLRNGVRLGFLIDNETETAYVYRPEQAFETVKGFDNKLSGGEVLPGFELDLRELRPQS
ncbi:Uma2 family endonuclease [Hymenobacter sp. ASUV-10]|uniref:Uma2 family endonuclease n=1 Tax=Hymenobacter aranciens TaxID=3063996 RepID=A0ABT9BG60_9BACT|nr:Uma2 family endonuclease [Hymenobacter sp. ASUV-10]MDO7877247.1 Uma2 family endonuclease [Hymenobacter sp. ASUV-10]